MFSHHVLAILAPTVARSFRRWVYHLGAVGFIPLGLLDSSLMLLPGSMDFLLIVLAASKKDFWLYYALMATLGSVLGGYVTYRLARRGGKERLARRFSPRRVETFCKVFERWGFGAIAVPAMLPPPVPMVPFVLAAGTMQYPLNKFLAALTLGRIIRYTALAFLAAHFGRTILSFISKHGLSFSLSVVALIAMGVAVYFVIRGTKGSGLPTSQR
jgi:membrane protein YqaA with SNARE-associated domain